MQGWLSPCRDFSILRAGASLPQMGKRYDCDWASNFADQHVLDLANVAVWNNALLPHFCFDCFPPGCVGPRQIGMWQSARLLHSFFSLINWVSVLQYYLQLDNHMFYADIGQSFKGPYISRWCTFVVTVDESWSRSCIEQSHTAAHHFPSRMFVTCFFGLKAMAIVTNDVPTECSIGLYSASTCDDARGLGQRASTH